MANELEIRQDFLGGLIEDNPLTDVATTLTSASLAVMAAVSTTSFMWIILDPDVLGGAPELVKVTAHTAGATTATILRGQGTTTARQHSYGIRWAHGPVSADDYRPRLLHVQDQKALGTAGGTFTSGAWQKRVLQTILTNELGVALASDEITGVAAGVYEVDASAPGYDVAYHQARLYDVTGAAVLVVGTQEYTNPAVDARNRSFVRGRFTLAVASTLRLEHRCTSTLATYGLGSAASLTTEIYADVMIRKVS